MGTRQTMIESTLRLLRRQGLSSTGINGIIRASGAPRGSLYFHFPGGKEQLTLEALHTAGSTVETRIRDSLAAHRSVAAALKKVVAWYVGELRRSGYQVGCPVANVASDAAAGSAAIREACAAIFLKWKALIAEGLVRDGVSRRSAPALAEMILASIEGALILCRAQCSTLPLQRVSEQILKLVSASK